MQKDVSPILRIERAQPRGVVFSQSPLSNTSVKTWHALVIRMLELAFLSRPVCFITPEENSSSWDLDLRRLAPDCETYLIGGSEYLCAFDRSVATGTLKAIAESQ